MRSKHVRSAVLCDRTSFPALRHALRPSGIWIVRGQWAQSLQVGGRTAAISDGEGELHVDQPREPLDGHALGDKLHVLIAVAIRQATSPEMDGLRLSDAHGQKDDAGNVGVAMRVQGKVFLIGHGSTVHARFSIARDK